MSKQVVILSGGMDSTVALYTVLDSVGYRSVSAISINYDQRHKKELEYAAATCRRTSVPHYVVDLRSINELIQSSSLTNPNQDVPEGHYEEDSMKATVVPNRNAIMLNIAIGHAVSIGANRVVTGVHAGDHAVYPDCRPEFIDKLTELAHVANEGFIPIDFFVSAPFVHMSKADIAKIGDKLNVPWEDTWTCYKGGEIHCGRCSTCMERIEAFSIAEVNDPTHYEDLSLYEDLVEQGKLK